MKVNFPNLAKEIDFQEVQEAQRVPKKLDSRRNTPRHVIIKLLKLKNNNKKNPIIWSLHTNRRDKEI